MPTLRQRFMLLAEQEPEQQLQYRRAWNSARDRLPDHVIHVEGSSVRLFPDGGLAATAEYSDAECEGFASWVVLCMLSYNAFY